MTRLYQEVSSGYQKAVEHYITEYIRAVLWRQLTEQVIYRVVSLQQQLVERDALLARFREVKKQVYLANAQCLLPPETDIGAIFSIFPRDFGYSSWLDKTPDSGFFEGYVVKSHLPNGAAAADAELPARFPDFFWKTGESLPELRGYAEWLAKGFRSDFPVGDVAYEGFKNWAARFIKDCESLYRYYVFVSLLTWPES